MAGLLPVDSQKVSNWPNSRNHWASDKGELTRIGLPCDSCVIKLALGTQQPSSSMQMGLSHCAR
ncbi:MAG: hypothetical protein OXC07_03435, partial [Kistimonas sp.]|nr:hypothetical protein [Kistimonas sp.]